MNSLTSMFRIITCLAIFGFSICPGILAGDHETASERTSHGGSFKLDRAPIFSFPDQILSLSSTPGGTQSVSSPIMTSTALSPGLTIGQTTYDFQSIGTGGRRVAVDPFLDFVYLVWTCQSNEVIPGDRGVCFAARNLTFGNFEANNVTGSDYAGFPAATVQPGGGLAFSCNARNLDPDSVFRSRYYYDGVPGLFIFQYEMPDTSRQTLWPQTATHHSANAGVTEDVVYVLDHDYPDGNDVYLCRKVGDSEWEPGVFMATTTNISYTIVADPTSDRVAMVYTDDRAGLVDGEGGQTDLDVYYRLSEDQGASWGDPINVSNYTLDSLWRAYADVSGLWTAGGVLHIVWAAREVISSATYYNYRSRLMHWSSDLQKASVVDEARYTTDYGGSECDPGSWALYIDNPSLAQCDNNLYVLYTKYGDDNEPGALGDCSDNGFANGELYMAASDDGGHSWDTSGNITKTRTPGCAAGDCESDAWASMAAYGIPYGDQSVPDTLDIVYINDRDAGAGPDGEGTWTLNDVKYLRLPCRAVPHVPRIDLIPTAYENHPAMHIFQGDTVILPLVIGNIGNAPLNIVEVRVEYYDGSDWIAFAPYTATIPLQEADTIPITFNAGATLAGYSNDVATLYEADIIITSDAPSGEDTIPVQLGVLLPGWSCEDVTATTKTLRVCSNAKLGYDTEGASLDIPGDCDADLSYPNADLYLYDASPMISYRRNDSNFAYTSINTQYPGESGTFKAVSPLTIIPITGIKDYNMAVCSLATTDNVFGVTQTIVASTDGNDFVYIIYEYYPLTTPNSLDEVYVGLIADWDIPSDNGWDNSSGYEVEPTPPIVWQRGVETNSTDEDPPHDCPILEDDRYGGIVLFSGDIKNVWTAKSSPLFQGSGMNPDSVYDRMSGMTGYNIYTGVGADSVADLLTGVTYAQVDMSSGAAYTASAALLTTNQGLTDLRNQASQAIAWTADWPFIEPCYCVPGDANGDGPINIGDAVYLISYIFRGGPQPTPYKPCSGDPNADCAINIGDAVYLISYIFRGGPGPVDCTTWTQSCGAYKY